ncbi:HDOD domain-containing protein [Aminipila butyrica]|uniref:HDOD domain-containing protein n=1 Tax=Aminipila butyrica TaxID=433296 RepID=A0A858BTJ0_9FIRM|nr:HDOD domain-containing protein [Aminipila butyrica]QIB68509.1 HDOD domain-containing protein [Aminipila butyrica]
MHIYIARQPIFNQMKDVIAYELLYRDPKTLTANISDADAATNSVLMGSILVASFEQLVEGKLAFINFTKNLINDGTPLLFSPKYMIVEILEDIVPDEAFIQRLRELKEKGYTLALDDFIADYPYKEIIDLVDIIKVDFLLTTREEQQQIIKRYKRPGLKFLAEKVETSSAFNRAKALNYDYFQGYYFAKPSVFKYKDMSTISTNLFTIIKMLDAKNPDYRALTVLFEQDIALTYKLFKYANSPMYGSMEQISTINRALVRLGFGNIRNCMYMILLRYISSSQNSDLVSVSLQRAKMMELLSTSVGLANRSSECFLVGLFSMLDVLTDKPIVKALDELPLSQESKEAILHQKNALGLPLKLILAYEKGNWHEVENTRQTLRLHSLNMVSIYMKALDWASEILLSTK